MLEFKKNIGKLVLSSIWRETVCDLAIKNLTSDDITVGNLEIYDEKMPFPKETKCYGEGYSMLTQYTGTISDMKTIGSFSDHGHYKLQTEEGYFQTYNMIVFSPEGKKSVLMGFTSCNRFSGIFRFNENRMRIILNLENIVIKPGETIKLESFFMKEGDKNDLLKSFGEQISINHKKLKTAEIPTGWCSWMVYGPDVKEEGILKNLDAIKERNIDLKYIQIDDGYQKHMGDWLQFTDKFSSGMEKLCVTIKEKGFEPAVWVAPFIAEKESELFKEHSDWFVKDNDGTPLPSDKYSYGGWRGAPWYMLDTSNPEAREHLEFVFRTMREKWGCKYFKLDANMWGAMPFGKRYEKNITSVEAYRKGMKAILDGAGYDSFLLGCNAPMWPSLGTVHGMRVTNDNLRSYQRFVRLAMECFPRNWQNNKLWINDPDTVLLRNNNLEIIAPDGKIEVAGDNIPEKEYMLCAGYILASGGMILSSDDISKMTQKQISVIKKMIPSTGVSAEFNEDMDYGIARQADGTRRVFLFNYGEVEKTFSIKVNAGEEALDFWSGKNEPVESDEVYTVSLRPHCCKVLKILKK